jgi:hypothetical protein
MGRNNKEGMGTGGLEGRMGNGEWDEEEEEWIERQ